MILPAFIFWMILSGITGCHKPQSEEPASPANFTVLYNKKLTPGTSPSEIVLKTGSKFLADGLVITQKDSLVRLDRFYALAERMVQYRVKFSSDAIAVFQSSEGDFKAYVDIRNKKISIATNPVSEKSVDFLQGNRDYLIEIYHIYQQAKVCVTDVASGRRAELVVTNDGQGGVGKGVVQTGFGVGMQWDHYCFGIIDGASMSVKEISVYSLKNNVKVLLYGDSITQPEGYFPTKDFPMAWTQQIINRLGGKAISSGRGGAQIGMLQNYIKNELPFIKAKYVMVTIGTNGGNTEANLGELVSYIKSQGAIPILNNIPCNESGSQINTNALIEKIRLKYNIRGIQFDVATSLQNDGKEVDKSTMYWEDYSGSYGWQIYHHPNEKGGARMFQRSLTDVPEIYQ